MAETVQDIEAQIKKQEELLKKKKERLAKAKSKVARTRLVDLGKALNTKHLLVDMTDKEFDVFTKQLTRIVNRYNSLSKVLSPQKGFNNINDDEFGNLENYVANVLNQYQQQQQRNSQGNQQQQTR